MKKHYVLAGLLMLAAAPGFAQVKIGAAGAPDASATLEVTGGAGNNKGLLLPRLTTTQRNAISNPAKGLLIFNTTTNEVQTNIGTPAVPVWSTTPVAGWNTTGNAGTNPATNFIGTTDNQSLAIRTNNEEVVRVTAGGNVGIGLAAPTVKLVVADTGTVAVRVASSNVGRMVFQLGNPWHGIARNLTNSGGLPNDVALYTSSAGASAVGALYLAANPYAGDSISLSQFTLKNNGNIGIGIKEPETKLHLNEGALTISSSKQLDDPAIHIVNDGGGGGQNDNLIIDSYGSSMLPSISMRTTRGTVAAPENIQAGTILGNLYFSGRRDGTQTNMGLISATYLGDGINRKTRMIFVAGQETSIAIDSSNNVAIGDILTPKTQLHVGGGILLGSDKNISHINGTMHTWNTVRPSTGEAEFVNYHGTGTGGFRFYDLSSGTAAFNTNNIAFIAPVTGAYTNVSDMRVKTNVNIINDGLQKVMAMRPVSYDFHSGRTIKNGVVKFTENDKVVKTIGFLAQELAKVVPEAVIIPKDPANELYNVSYATVVPVLTKAIQEQQAEIEQLKATLAVAKADNAALKADVSKISALAERMQRLEASLNTTASTAVSK